MKGSNGDRASTAQDRVAVNFGERLDIGTEPGNDRRSNKHRMKWCVQPNYLDVSLETVDLATVAVTRHRHVEHSQGVLIISPVANLRGHQNHAGASPEYRQTLLCTNPQRVQHLRPLKQHRHGRRFAAGHYQRINRCQLIGCADLLRRTPQRLEDHRVSGEGTLKGKDSNCWCYQPRSANFMSSFEISWPAMASPRPVDTFTKIAGSW